MNQKISVIIPAYNKDLIIFKALISIYRNLSKITDNFEIIVVNDGSTDKTLFESKRFKIFNGNSNKIQIYDYNYNIGKGHALRYGFFNSTGDIVVFFDADLDIGCSKITDSVRLLQQKNADIVIGSKYHPASYISYPKIRFLYSKILQILVRILFNLNVTDTQVGMKTFKRSVLERTIPALVVKRFAFDLELLVVAHMYGFHRIIEMPIVLKHNKLTSTVNFREVRKFLLDMLAIFYRKNLLGYYHQKNDFIHRTPTFQKASF